MNSNRLLEIDAILTERLCPNCRSMDEMREEILDEGYSFTCLQCDWQTIIKRDEIQWIKSEVPALKLSELIND